MSTDDLGSDLLHLHCGYKDDMALPRTGLIEEENIHTNKSEFLI